MDQVTLLKIHKEIFEERCKGLSKVDVKWLLKKVISLNPNLEGYENDHKKEWRVYSCASSLLYGVLQDNPSDFREFIEKQLLKKDFDDKLNRLSDEVYSIKPGDVEACNKLRSKIDALLEKAEEKFPGFQKGRALMISELMGDIIAVRTKGKAGSTRMLAEMHKKQEKKQKKKTKSS